MRFNGAIVPLFHVRDCSLKLLSLTPNFVPLQNYRSAPSAQETLCFIYDPITCHTTRTQDRSLFFLSLNRPTTRQISRVSPMNLSFQLSHLETRHFMPTHVHTFHVFATQQINTEQTRTVIRDNGISVECYVEICRHCATAVFVCMIARHVCIVLRVILNSCGFKECRSAAL